MATGTKPCRHFCVASRKRPNIFNPARRQHDHATALIYNAEHQITLVLLTNNFELDAWAIAELYRNRWQVELFFKWIKQHLRLRGFYGRSQNAVRCQIWSAICAYLMVAIMKKELGIQKSLYEILQIVSVNAFEQVPLHELLTDAGPSVQVNDRQKLLLFQD